MQTESEPLVSIITPVYNGEKFISECLESIRTQTYSNFEHIIVNNCSTDRTGDCPVLCIERLACSHS